MKKILTLLVFGVVSAAMAATITPQLQHNGTPLSGFRKFDQDGKPMLYLNAGYGQFGSAVIRFEGGPGEYMIELDTIAPEPECAATGLYLLLEDGHHQMLCERLTAAAGKIESVRLSSVAAKPVKGLVVKKMENRKAPTAAVGNIRINFIPEPEAVKFELGHTEEFRIAGLTFPEQDRVEYDGAVGAGPAPDRGRFAWSEVRLGKKMPAGVYDFDGEFLIPVENCVPVALYAIGENGKHMPVRQNISGRLPRKQQVKATFTASEPFSALAVKKEEARRGTPAALADFKLTMVPERRLSAAREIFRYPAPFGIRSAELIAARDGAAGSQDPQRVTRQAAEAEAWLDRAAAVADAEAEYRELRRTASAIPGAPETAVLEQTSAATRNAVREPEISVFRKAVAGYRAELNRIAGGEVSPDHGSDIHGWLKNFETVTRRRFPEYGEPTPYRIAGPGKLVVSFRRPDGSGVFESGRTANRYRHPEAEYIFSVLTPVMTIDPKTTVLTAEVAGLERVEKLGDGMFLLSGEEQTQLAVVGRSLRRVALQDGRLELELDKPERIGLFFCTREQAGRAAEFYLARLNSLPTDLVQIQRGGRIVQQARDSAGRKAGYFPVSPLFQLGLESPLPPRTDAKFDTTPDGLPIVAGNPDAFEYHLPEGRPVRAGIGVNLFDAPHPPELYRELKERGCGVLRLACGTATEWNWEKPEIMRDALLHNLELAKQHGLSVGIDLHGGWTPDKEFGPIGSESFSRELLRRWKTIIEWAAPYRDTLAWYDLMNEPRIYFEKESVAPYWKMIKELLPELRAADSDTPIMVEVANMGNPVGAWHYEPLPGDSVIISYHDYWPHMFTHLRVPDGGSEGMPVTAYPGFMPMISWTAPSWRNDNPQWYYWDRWKVDAVSHPVYRMLVKYAVPADCGEFGVVGYAGAARNSGRIWLEDTLRRLKKMGVSGEVWGVNGGYVWNTPHFREVILENWEKEIAGRNRK